MFRLGITVKCVSQSRSQAIAQMCGYPQLRRSDKRKYSFLKFDLLNRIIRRFDVSQTGCKE